jgi:hypothetical protein
VSCKLEPSLRSGNTRETVTEKCFSKNNNNGCDQLHIGIEISQSSASLTKIVTFTPYMMAYNGADFHLQLKAACCCVWGNRGFIYLFFRSGGLQRDVVYLC